MSDAATNRKAAKALAHRRKCREASPLARPRLKMHAPRALRDERAEAGLFVPCSIGGCYSPFWAASTPGAIRATRGVERRAKDAGRRGPLSRV